MTMLQHEIVKTPPAIPSSNRLDSSPTRRIPSLDGLRAISVGFVIFGHMAECGQAPRFLERYANFGVQVFFIISGYLITTLLLKERLRKGSIDLKAFYIRRVLRIFPAAYVFIAVAVVVFRPHLRDVIMALTYVSNFNATRPWELGHLWSLAVEEQFYLLWPATMVLFFARSRLILISVVAVVPLANIALHLAHLSSLIGTAFPSVADSLALGCLAAFFPTVNLKNKIFAWSGPLALLIQSIPNTGHLTAAIQVLLFWPTIHILITIFLVHVVERHYVWLNVRPLIWIGTLSYSLYLWQQPFLNRSAPVPFGLLLLFFCGIASYYFIEKPFLRLKEVLSHRLAVEHTPSGQERAATTD